MQPASKSSLWNAKTAHQDGTEEPPMKMQAIELPEAESDEEYEAVPKKSKKEKSPQPAVVPATTPAPVEIAAAVEPEPMEGVVDSEPVNGVAATDDDWLRSRTNRLLDLMDPNQIAATTGATSTSAMPSQAVTGVVTETLALAHEEPQAETSHEPENGDSSTADFTDPTIEAIKENGRLFVRNLPYTATEDDLREHFAVYGVLEEVRAKFTMSFFLVLNGFMMNIQIGTTYAYKHMMRTGREF